MGEEKQGFWSRLVSGLTKTRDNIVSGFDSIFNGFSNIDDDFYEEIEEILIMGDIGVNATESIMESLRQKVKENRIKEPSACKELLIHSIKEQMDVGETAYRFEQEKSVVLIIGVNGVGKTTSVGKLAGKLKDQGKRVVLAGGHVSGGGGKPACRVGEPGRRGNDRGTGGRGSRGRGVRCGGGGEGQKRRCPALRYGRAASQ